MTLKELSLFIFNGGLDPELADPSQLRRRRTLATTWILLLPVAAVLVLANTYLAFATGRNISLGAGVLVALAGLYLQAFKGWERFASYSLVFTFWFASTSAMVRLGINSGNWTWLLTGALLANLVANRFVAIVYTVFAVSTLISIAVMSNADMVPLGLKLENHGMTVAVIGSLGLTVMTILGYTFRSIQNTTEEKLRANLLRLENEVSTRQQAEQQARAAQKAKAEFLATVSHELRTPLNGVLGAGNLLKNTKLYGAEPELIDTVNHSGDLLLDLINNVLDLSRLEAGRLELEQVTFHVETMVSSAIAPFKILGADKSEEVSYQIGDEVPDYLVGDPTRIRQIILNLCDNAVGSIKQGKVHVAVSYANKNLCLIVTYSGIDSANQNQTTQFDISKLESIPTSQATDGVGLGLSIVAELVDLFDGKFSMQSAVGQGTVFTVTIPVQPGVAGKAQKSQLDNELTDLDFNLTVLVTDDNVINRKVVSRMLEQLGCEVVEAVDGQQALTALSSKHIDVVLMDVNMPVMDGLMATAHIRAMDEPFCNTPIIGLTANALPSNKDVLIAAGMDDALSKPVKLETLRNTLTHNRCLA